MPTTATFKVTFIFAADKNGWSEVWYVDKSTITDTIPPAKLVAGARVGLLGLGVKIEAMRVSSITRPFKSRLVPLGLGWGVAPPPADTSWNTVLATCIGPNEAYKRVTQLRGVVDDWIKFSPIDGQPIDPMSIGELRSAWTRYRQALADNQFLFQQRSLEGADGTELPATAFDKDDQGRVRFNAAGITGGPGSFITLAEVTGPGAASFTKGRHKIKSNAAGVITLETRVPNDVEPSTWSVGKVRPYAKFYSQVSTGDLLRFSHRDTGRRFFVTRGRRPRRAPLPS